MIPMNHRFTAVEYAEVMRINPLNNSKTTCLNEKRKYVSSSWVLVKVVVSYLVLIEQK